MIRPDRSTIALKVDEFRDRVQKVYDEVDAQVALHAPTCLISGRCCRFEEYEHTLFVSSPEFAILLADAPEPCRPIDDGATCPWQDAKGHCTAREARPLGCRVYFCDPSYQHMAPLIAESGIRQLKDLVDEAGLPWDYAPLHHHLHRAVAEGQLPTIPEAPSD